MEFTSHCLKFFSVSLEYALPLCLSLTFLSSLRRSSTSYYLFIPFWSLRQLVTNILIECFLNTDESRSQNIQEELGIFTGITVCLWASHLFFFWVSFHCSLLKAGRLINTAPRQNFSVLWVSQGMLSKIQILVGLALFCDTPRQKGEPGIWIFSSFPRWSFVSGLGTIL